MVDDPTDLGETIMVAQALCFPSSTYPLGRKPAFLPMVIKLTCLLYHALAVLILKWSLDVMDGMWAEITATV